MMVDGTGGRSYPGERNEVVINGLLTTGERYTIRIKGYRCANSRCRRVFVPRADGDLYCCEPCDLNANPNLRGKKGGART